MAGQSIGYGNSLVETNQRKGLILSSELATFIHNFSGESRDNALVTEDRPGVKRGESVEIRYAAIGTVKAPLTRSSQILGQEDHVTPLTDSVAMRWFVKAGAIENTEVDQELVSFDLKDAELERLGREWGYLQEQWVCTQLAGIDATGILAADDYGLSGGNVVTPPDANSFYFAPDTATNANEAAVAADAASVLTTDCIDELEARAVSREYGRQWPIAPASTPFGDYYIFLVSVEGMKQIRDNTASSVLYDLSRARIEGGGDWMTNPIYSGEGFIYNHTLVLRTDFIQRKIANAQRAIFMGAQAGCFLRGTGYTGGDYLGWKEHTEYWRWSCAASHFGGFKASIVNGERFGSIVATHYSVNTSVAA